MEALLRSQPGMQVSSIVTNRSAARSLVTDGLYIHYDIGNSACYPGSGTALTDLSGGGRNATLINGVGYSSNNGGALVFDGINDYVQTNDKITFTPYCYNYWAFNNSTIVPNDGAVGGPSTYQSVTSWDNSSYYGINYGGWTSNATGEALHIWDSSTSRLTYTNQTVPGGIRNITFNWNGSNYDIWLDGIKQNSIAGSTGHAQLMTHNSQRFRIGGHTNSGYYFWGSIFVFSVYTSQLTDAQIIQNFNTFYDRFRI